MAGLSIPLTVYAHRHAITIASKADALQEAD
jgi:hypothetical protein